MPENVKRLYERHRGNRTRPSFNELSEALHSIIADYSKVFIIIDALDECQVSDGSRKRLLSEIFRVQAKTGANVFAISRFIPEIEKELEDPRTGYLSEPTYFKNESNNIISLMISKPIFAFVKNMKYIKF